MRSVIVAAIFGFTMAMLCPQLSRADPEPVIVCETEPPSTNLLIQYGDIVECAIDVVRDFDFFRFQGTAGQTIILALMTRPVASRAITAQLFAPSDTLITPLERLHSWQTKHIVLPETGIYVIRVSESGNDDTALYRLALERFSPASPTARPFGNPNESEFDETLSDTIAPALDRDIFLLEVKANAPIILTLTNLTSTCGRAQSCPMAQLFAPNGTLLKTLRDSHSTGVLVLTEQGTYTVHVAERENNQNVSYSLSVQCATGDPGDCKPPSPAGPVCDGLTASIRGTDADDVLFGTRGDDVIVGLDGDDTIYGGNGNDVICGGRGADILFGQAGDDRLLGEEGHNYLSGGGGNDRLFGGPERDILFGGPGNDELFSQEGNDYLSGDTGDDMLQGGIGANDVCDGGAQSNGDSTDGSCEAVRRIP